jgi:hypothetical protein
VPVLVDAAHVPVRCPASTSPGSVPRTHYERLAAALPALLDA